MVMRFGVCLWVGGLWGGGVCVHIVVRLNTDTGKHLDQSENTSHTSGNRLACKQRYVYSGKCTNANIRYGHSRASMSIIQRPI